VDCLVKESMSLLQSIDPGMSSRAFVWDDNLQHDGKEKGRPRHRDRGQAEQQPDESRPLYCSGRPGQSSAELGFPRPSFPSGGKSRFRAAFAPASFILGLWSGTPLVTCQRARSILTAAIGYSPQSCIGGASRTYRSGCRDRCSRHDDRDVQPSSSRQSAACLTQLRNGYAALTASWRPTVCEVTAPWLELKSNAIERMGLIGPKHSHRNMVGLIRNSGWCVIEALLVRDNRIG
jgi:hypothetical protein